MDTILDISVKRARQFINPLIKTNIMDIDKIMSLLYEAQDIADDANDDTASSAIADLIGYFDSADYDEKVDLLGHLSN